MTERSPISRQDVMSEFAMDFEPGTDVLKRYLSLYPQYASDLVDLAREISREVDEERPLSARELAAMHSKLLRLRVPLITLDALQSASPKAFASAAKALGMPTQIGIAIRERRVDVAMLPIPFLERLSAALQTSVAVMREFLLLPAQASVLRANKSDDKPTPAEKVPLERLLKEAGLDEESITRLLYGDD